MEFIRGMRGAVHVAFEEGTQAQWLHDLLVPLVDRVVVCDRRGQGRQGNKADRVDADELSELLRRGGLRTVYHGSGHRATLKELTRAYQNLLEDSTRVMQRLKALFRARGIKASGTRVYHPSGRAEWLEKLAERGARFRAEALYAELDVLREQGPKAKAAMVAEAGRPVRRRRAPMTRGLNRNYNRVLKDVFKGGAAAATAQPGPLQEFYHGMIARGMREELARVTLARKLAAITLRLWKRGEQYDPTKLTTQAF